MTKGTTKPEDATDKSGTDKSGTDKPSTDKPDSTDSKTSDCGETTEETSCKQSDVLSVALMAQQLPLPSKFNGNDLSSDETFEEWITHFELVAEMHK